MSKSLVVRYRTKPECAEENARLIGDVFAELAQTRPDGLSYRAYRLADGVGFVHDGDAVGRIEIRWPASPLSLRSSPASRERCADGPAPSDATVLGSFG